MTVDVVEAAILDVATASREELHTFVDRLCRIVAVVAQSNDSPLISKAAARVASLRRVLVSRSLFVDGSIIDHQFLVMTRQLRWANAQLEVHTRHATEGLASPRLTR